jgi:hypothetical protein
MMPRARSGRLNKKLMMDQPSRDASSNSSWSQLLDSAETLWTTTEKPYGKCATLLKSNSSLKIRKSKERISSSLFSKSGSTLLMLFLK